MEVKHDHPLKHPAFFLPLASKSARDQIMQVTARLPGEFFRYDETTIRKIAGLRDCAVAQSTDISSTSGTCFPRDAADARAVSCDGRGPVGRWSSRAGLHQVVNSRAGNLPSHVLGPCPRPATRKQQLAACPRCPEKLLTNGPRKTRRRSDRSANAGPCCMDFIRRAATPGKNWTRSRPMMPDTSARRGIALTMA